MSTESSFRPSLKVFYKGNLFKPLQGLGMHSRVEVLQPELIIVKSREANVSSPAAL
jgi:hypothetical protein